MMIDGKGEVSNISNRWGCGHNPGPDNTSGGMLCIHSNKEKKL